MKQVISILLLWIGVLSCQSEDINIYTLHAKDESKAIDGWKLIWSEEFNQEGPQFDADKWIFEPKGNSPWNKYLTGSTEQAYVQNGRLILRAEKKDGQYMTGGISTRGKAGFKYGKLEICAKFNSFQGGWPAIWLLPVQRQYPNPPGANEYGGEIDIMEQVSLEKVAAKVAELYNLPVFLYEKSATAPHRENLASVRKGEFEGMAEKIKLPEWQPDFGPAERHPTAGTVAIGARMPLVAYNINLSTDNMEIATKIAKNIRHINGGLRYVKAMGVELKERNITQVSINMTD